MAIDQTLLDALQDDPDTLAVVMAMDAQIDAQAAQITSLEAGSINPVAVQAVADWTVFMGTASGDQLTARAQAAIDFMANYQDAA